MIETASIESILRKARVLMDEVSAEPNIDLESDDSIFTSDTVNLSTTLEGVLPDAVSFISKIAPTHKMSTKTERGRSLYDHIESASFYLNGFGFKLSESGYGVISLPDDFLRFSSVKMKSWKRAVSEIQDMGTRLWKEQYLPETEAGFFKPVCNWVDIDGEKKCIEVHPTELKGYYEIEGDKGGESEEFRRRKYLASKIEYFSYIPMPKVDISSGTITPNLDKSLEPAVAYMCAALALLVYEKKNEYESFKQVAIEIAETA